MRDATEQEIQKSIIDYLRIKQYVVFKHHSTGSTIRQGKPVYFAHGEKGVADIIACSPKGSFVAIEVKRPGKKPTPEQVEFLKRVNAYNGIGILAQSLNDVIDKVG
jgi:hypothetical protein